MPKNTIYLILVAVCLLVFSCTRKIQHGVYLGSAMFNKPILELMPNNRFSYTVRNDIMGVVTVKGDFQIKKNRLFLKITEPFDIDSLIKPDKLIEKYDPAIKRTRISVLAHDTIPMWLTDLYLNNDTISRMLEGQTSVLVDKKVFKLQVVGLCLKNGTRRFMVNDTSKNDLKVILYDSAYIPPPCI